MGEEFCVASVKSGRVHCSEDNAVYLVRLAIETLHMGGVPEWFRYTTGSFSAVDQCV